MGDLVLNNDTNLIDASAAGAAGEGLHAEVNHQHVVNNSASAPNVNELPSSLEDRTEEEQTQQPFTMAILVDNDDNNSDNVDSDNNDTQQLEGQTSQPTMGVLSTNIDPPIDASQPQSFDVSTPQDNTHDELVSRIIDNNPERDCKVIIEPLMCDFISTPKKTKKGVLAMKRNTPMVRRTRAGAARKMSEKAPLESYNNKQELLILRAENQILKNNLENLEQTIASQNNELTEFRAELKFLTLEVKRISEVHVTSEHRFELLLEEQETKCTKRAQDVSIDSQKKRDKLSTKIQQLSQNNSTEKTVSEETTDKQLSAIETSFKEEIKKLQGEHDKDMRNLQADIDRVDHVTATIQSHVANWNSNGKTDPLPPVIVDTSPREIVGHDYSQPHNTGKPTPTQRLKHPPPLQFQHPPPAHLNMERQQQKQGLPQQHFGQLSPIKEHEIPTPLSSSQNIYLQPSTPNIHANFGASIPNGRATKSNPHENRNNREDPQTKDTGKLAKTLIIMDSNQKHLTPDLWKNSTVHFCPTANELSSKCSSLLHKHNPDMVLIHTGVNDLDKVDGATVARSLAQTVQKMNNMRPNLKIIVSEITPRKINKDDQVILCNQHLHTYFEAMNNVVMAIHSNLRTENWEFHEDDKHFLQASIGKFASNLKVALRKTIGMAERPKKKIGQRKSQADSVSDLKKKLLAVLQGK